MLIGLVPVYNEERNVAGVLNELENQLDYIIIVNDGSLDKTGPLISDRIQNRQNIHYISYERNRGMSYALLQGFNFISAQYKKRNFSREDVIVTIDADGQHNPNEIRGMYKYFVDNRLDVLIAERDFSEYPMHRILGNRILSSIASALGKFKFNDIECGFKILKLAFVDDLLNYYTGYRYSCAGEIGIAAAILGYNVGNRYKIETHYYGKSGTKFIDFFVDLIFYLVIFLKIKFAKIPLYRLRNLQSQDNPYSQHKMS